MLFPGAHTCSVNTQAWQPVDILYLISLTSQLWEGLETAHHTFLHLICLLPRCSWSISTHCPVTAVVE